MQQRKLLGKDHNKPHSLITDPTSSTYFHNMSCDLSNKILLKPNATQFPVEPSMSFNST